MNPSPSRSVVEVPPPPLGPRSAHPVAGFVVAIVALLAILGGIRLSGTVNPYVEVTTTGSGSISGETGDLAVVRELQTVEVHNRGLTTVRLTEASFEDGAAGDPPIAAVFLRQPGDTGTGWSLSAPIGPRDVGFPGPDLRPFRPVDIAPGQIQVVQVVHRTTCDGQPGTLHLAVESALHRVQTFDRPMSASSC